MKPLRILFVGNSHTYLHKMPWILCELAAACDGVGTVEAEQCTGKGVGLGWHWRCRATQDKIAAGCWDFVVLQERSGGTLEDADGFYRHARLFDSEIRQRGGRTVFYMTWAGRDRPQDQAAIASAYRRVSKDVGALLSPVGHAWQQALAANPASCLYDTDGRHAGPRGAYLTACVFYSLLFGKSPEGLPGTICTRGKLRVDLDAREAAFLQRIALSAVCGDGICHPRA